MTSSLPACMDQRAVLSTPGASGSGPIFTVIGEAARQVPVPTTASSSQAGVMPPPQ